MSIPLGVPVQVASHAYPVLDAADEPAQASDALPMAVPLDATGDDVALPAAEAFGASSLSDKARSKLEAQGFPAGLISQLEASCVAFPVRFFVLDNSGSMNAPDGTRLHRHAGSYRTLSATRWEELSDSVTTIAELTEALGVRSDFHLLNSAGTMPQFVSVGGQQCGGWPTGKKASDAPSVPTRGKTLGASEFTAKMRMVTPSGTTPLTEAVERIVWQIEPAAAQLRAAGQSAVVTLMTDGLPNDKRSFAAALRKLQALPVWLVVRLCTDDESIVRYWDELDQQLEAGLEVLDDEAGEASEVHGKNKWLTYGPPLHVARTFGLAHKLFDLLDEQSLAPAQARALCELLLGGALPEPQLEPEAFADALRAALSDVPAVYDPVRRCSRPWVDVHALMRVVTGESAGESGCVIL